ncbi:MULTISPECIES: YfbU family protein [Acinetobacter calcoaceticus/baumannii complex]|uniref:YfbU family protein n=1 Tax=Acinetobacter calcoaceticus/baumannii complex TaxID=909768 RepID=UPI00197F616E|nr:MULTISPECIES: YfbU family protein [Acinetobacter calcoaceticus/baumannii complex]MBN6524799.1 YfbU family protein [Acinetobacter pittii]MDH2522819.1 YfbU family protein [Acinetobacter baumannii]HCI7175208.1 YfbU family protein [Acinetobacter baumannii]HCJ1341069.1 YfbU family protein [Acinetobacter baumannii]
MDIELTDKERLILANQYEILGLLKKEDYYLDLAEQLRDGHKWLYEQSFDTFSDNLSDEDAELVLDTLELYEALKDSYDALSDTSGLSPQDVKFAGFDGNNESEFMRFVDALKKSNRFVDVIDAGVRNSHMRKVHIYETMIQKWNGLNRSNTLTKDQILFILGR